MMADMEVDKVADNVADKVANNIHFGQIIGHLVNLHDQPPNHNL